MSRRVLGVAVSRCDVTLACVAVGRWKTTVVTSISTERCRAPLSVALSHALKSVPSDFQRCAVHMALSARELNCVDCFDVPFRSEAQLAAIVGSLAEERCAGSVVEDLAVDHQCVMIAGKMIVRIIALSHFKLDEIQSVIRKELPGATLQIVTGSLVAMAESLRLKSRVFAFAAHGEALVIRFDGGGNAEGWRSFPVHSAYTLTPLTDAAKAFATNENELRVSMDRVDVGLVKNSPIADATAIAVAQIKARGGLNLLRGAKNAPRSVLGKLRMHLIFAGAAAAVLMLSAGLYFSRQIRALEAGEIVCDEFERDLWDRALPGEKYVPGELNVREKKILAQHNKTTEANKFPSALSFWSEIAAVQPDANRLGFALDSMQLGLDGGRILGRVSKGERDPLLYASQLEAAFEKSNALSARGEFENGGSDITVRLRLDYPKPGSQSRGANSKLNIEERSK